MRLSLQTDYALRTLLYLALKPGRAQISAVAEFYRISKDHVAKSVNALARMGFVRTVRGVGGGIELAKTAPQISVGEVITALEGNLHLLDCVGTPNVCVIQPGCKLRNVFAEAERLQRNYLNNVHLSDLVTPNAGLLSLQSPLVNAVPCAT